MDNIDWGALAQQLIGASGMGATGNAARNQRFGAAITPSEAAQLRGPVPPGGFKPPDIPMQPSGIDIPMQRPSIDRY